MDTKSTSNLNEKGKKKLTTMFHSNEEMIQETKESSRGLVNAKQNEMGISLISSPTAEINFYEYKENFSLTFKKNEEFSKAIATTQEEEKYKKLPLERVVKEILPFSTVTEFNLTRKKLPIPKYLSLAVVKERFNK